MDDVETKVRNLLENRKHNDEEKMQIKNDLGKLQSSHDKMIQDIKGMHNQVSENSDKVQKIYLPKLNEIENSRLPSMSLETGKVQSTSITYYQVKFLF